MWNKNTFKCKAWFSRLTLFIISLIIPLLINGCILQQNNTLQTFRVGINNWPGFDIVLYAQEAELFKKRGLEVELVRFQNGLDSSRAMLRGSIDAAFEIVSQQLDQTPESFSSDYAGLKKGDITMNLRMFEPQGRLSQALKQIKKN